MMHTNKSITSYLPILAFPLWMVIIVVPFLTRSTRVEWSNLSNFIVYYHYSGILIFFTFLILHRPNILFNCSLIKSQDLPKFLINIFFGSLFYSSFLSLDVGKSLSYTVVTYITVLFFSRLWMEEWNRVRIGLYLFGGIIFALLFLAVLYHGMPRERWIGGIHPNHFAGIALSAMVALFFQSTKIRVIAAVLALISVVLVNSRGGLLAVIDFVACYTLLALIGRRTVKQLGLLIFIFTIIFFGSAIFLSEISEQFLSITKINDQARGLGSGLTGRSQNWDVILNLIAERPFSGYGFRTENVLTLLIHNAYLKLFLQVGLFGGVVFILLSLIQGWRMLALCIQIAPYDEEKANIYRVIASAIFMIMINGLLESVMINIGFPLPILFLFLLVAPTNPHALLRR
jgi:O-antigen ligase